MSYYVYVLRSQKDNRNYVGFTKDIKERVKRHNSGGVQSTKYRRPLKLVCFRRFNTLKEAVAYEKKLKNK